jgi:hypothetical protein
MTVDGEYFSDLSDVLILPGTVGGTNSIRRFDPVEALVASPWSEYQAVRRNRQYGRQQVRQAVAAL